MPRRLRIQPVARNERVTPLLSQVAPEIANVTMFAGPRIVFRVRPCVRHEQEQRLADAARGDLIESFEWKPGSLCAVLLRVRFLPG